MASSLRPVVLRNGVEIEDPLRLVLGCIEAGWHLGAGSPLRPTSFAERDLRLANQAGARISAVEIAAILGRRRRIERALGAIAPTASLAGPASAVPWQQLEELFDAFADIRGVGLSKTTKTMHWKRPGLIPMLDSVVQKHLEDDDLGAQAPFAERALALVRGYKRDLDGNRAALRTVRREVAMRECEISEVRILDLLIWTAEAAAR